MELRNATVVLLGGSGLVGHAVARRLLEKSPRRLVLVALFEHEVREAAQALEPHRGQAAIDVEWGNVFLPAPVARLERSTMLAETAHRALVLGDLLGDLTDAVLERSLLYQILTRYRPDAVVDSINTATAFAYQDIFHSARDLLAQARVGALTEAAVESHLLTLTMPQLIRHTQIMFEGLRAAGTRAYVKIGTSGTGGMGFNIPYTHSEERPSRTLMTKSAVAGAQSLLLFLMGRTPGAPATVEIKPTATIAWREIATGPVWRKGKPIPLVDCPEPVPVSEAFAEGAAGWRDLGQSLEGVFINTGENGLFARDEFATVTALGQMEFITPEEVADYVVYELEGRPTGKDIVAGCAGACVRSPFHRLRDARATPADQNALRGVPLRAPRADGPCPRRGQGGRSGRARARPVAPGRRAAHSHPVRGTADRDAGRPRRVSRAHGNRSADGRRRARGGASGMGGPAAGHARPMDRSRGGNGAAGGRAAGSESARGIGERRRVDRGGPGSARGSGGLRDVGLPL
jgi:hypothetical protein